MGLVVGAGAEYELIGAADTLADLDPAASQPHREAVRVVVAARPLGVFGGWLAADLAPKVRVNAIAPGSIETEALGSVLNDELEALTVAGTSQPTNSFGGNTRSVADFDSAPIRAVIVTSAGPLTGNVFTGNVVTPCAKMLSGTAAMRELLLSR